MRLVAFAVLGAPGIPVMDSPPCVLRLRTFSCPLVPFMDVRQFTQKDLEVAVKAMQMENLKLTSKYEELHAKCSEMGKITIGFLGVYPGDGEGTETEAACQS